VLRKLTKPPVKIIYPGLAFDPNTARTTTPQRSVIGRFVGLFIKLVGLPLHL